MRTRTFVIAAVSCLALLVGSVPATAATNVTSAVDLPLEKARFAMAVGGLQAGSTTNWVRLGLYDFATDGTVSEEHWHWTQRRREVRTSTGVRANNCPSRDCVVETAYGFQSTAAPQRLDGTYSVDGDTLRIE